MENLSKRQYRIINFLKKSEESLSSEYLSKIIGASSKTIRKDILEMKEILKRNGAIIDSKTGDGYLLTVKNQDVFDAFIGTFVDGNQEKMLKLPMNYQRAHYIVRRVIAAKDYCKISDFSDELFTSRATITQDMPMVRKILERFNLQLNTRAKYGLRVVGSEQSIRNCFIYENEYYEDNNLNVSEPEYEQFMKIPDDFLDQTVQIIIQTLRSFPFVEVSYQNILRLARIVYLIHYRSSDYPLHVFEESERKEVQQRISYKVSTIAAMQCERTLGVHFSEEDLIYFNNCLDGYRNITSYGSLRNRSDYFQCYEIVTELIEYLSDVNGFENMRHDSVLVDSLTRHFLSMLIRCRNYIGIHCDDNSMKRMTTTSVELAAQTAQWLKEHYGYVLNEDEVLFLIYIFSPIFGRYLPKVAKKKIVIISHISTNVGSMLAERFERNFSGYLDSIDVLDIVQLEETDLSEIDFIFTTLDKKYFKKLNCSVPIIEIQTYFPESKKQDFRNLFSNMTGCYQMMEKLFNRKCFFSPFRATDKQDVFRKAANLLHTVFELDDSFKADLIQRDNWVSAEMGKNLGRIKTLRPHGPESFVSIFILDRPILWDTEYIQIFQIWHQGTNPEFNMFVESGYTGNVLKTMFGFKDCSVRLLDEPTYECFQGLLKDTVREIRSLQLR